ncbi:MAG: hypothetical protein J4432_01425 [DPANN group archaeon]|nr:hypothetical protein [DPANN group archaeon]
MSLADSTCGRGFIFSGATFLLATTILISYGYLIWASNTMDESIPRIMEFDSIDNFAQDALRIMLISGNSAFTDSLQDAAAASLSAGNEPLCRQGQVSSDGVPEGCCMYTYQASVGQACNAESVKVTENADLLSVSVLNRACDTLRDSPQFIETTVSNYITRAAREAALLSNYKIQDLKLTADVTDTLAVSGSCGLQVRVNGSFVVTDSALSVRKTQSFNLTKVLQIQRSRQAGQVLMQEIRATGPGCTAQESLQVNYTEVRDFANIQVRNQQGQLEYGNRQDGLFHISTFVIQEQGCVEKQQAQQPGVTCNQVRPFCNSIALTEVT